MLPKAKQNEAVRLLQSGLSYNAIAKQLGACNKNVSAYLKSVAPPRPTNAERGVSMPTQTCAHCGRTWAAYGQRTYCSRECHNKAAVEWDDVRILFEIHKCSGSSIGRETLVTVARRMFGSWSKACAIAGVVPPSESVKACVQCGADVPHAEGKRTHCSAACSRKTNLERWAKYWAARLAKYKQGDAINPRAVYARDAWVCGICGEDVNPAFRYPNPMRASLDHVVPLSKGGPHTYENVQCAHLSCNSSKGVS